MDKVVLDTSVVVKWFVDESDSDKAQEILEQQKKKKIQIMLPDIVLLELINGLYYGNKYNQANLIKVIETMFQLKIIYKSLNGSLLSIVSLLVIRNKIQSYDAFFIALAEQEKCSLITADYKHHRREISKMIKHL